MTVIQRKYGIGILLLSAAFFLWIVYGYPSNAFHLGIIVFLFGIALTASSAPVKTQKLKWPTWKNVKDLSYLLAFVIILFIPSVATDYDVGTVMRYVFNSRWLLTFTFISILVILRRRYLDVVKDSQSKDLK